MRGAPSFAATPDDVHALEVRQPERFLYITRTRVPTTAIVVQTLDPQWLVEIEAIAVA
jgi:enamine deaminase RidA (YjgF/YER057c/UK114 family)